MSKITSNDWEWESLKNGTTLQMKDFPTVRVLKLDNSKGCYFSYENKIQIVDIKEYESEEIGHYYVFQTCETDWHPLTKRLWKLYD